VNTTPHRLIEYMNSAQSYLAGKGVDNPRRSAEALLSITLDLPRIQLYMQHDRLLQPDEVSRYRELIRRRAEREPLQLIIGTVQFCGVTIKVSPGLLIPRPETEELAAYAIDWIEKSEGQLRLLDIGTGTGCLAVAIAAASPMCVVDAVDVDPLAVSCSRENAKANQVSDRVRVRQTDFLASAFVDGISEPYDLVVSNPPYVAERDFESLAPEIQKYESRRALVADEDGLLFYHRMRELTPRLLKRGGRLVVETGYNQAERVRDLLADTLRDVVAIADLARIPRIVTGVRS
jgi:release factor glutamine methyltransferase